MVRTIQAESMECQVIKLHIKLCFFQNATCTEGLLHLCLPSLILLGSIVDTGEGEEEGEGGGGTPAKLCRQSKLAR